MCEVFTPGVGWNESYYLREQRDGHASWTLNNGSVVLLGGSGSSSTSTTEVVTLGSGSTLGFELRHFCV